MTLLNYIPVNKNFGATFLMNLKKIQLLFMSDQIMQVRQKYCHDSYGLNNHELLGIGVSGEHKMLEVIKENKRGLGILRFCLHIRSCNKTV